jgi:hypothetical protein
MDDLLQVGRAAPSSDPDYLAFASGDADFFLRAAGEVIRDYCGWHIAPSISDVYEKLAIGSQGIIMLPSGYVTEVTSVTITSPAGDTVLDPATDYVWYRQGFIEAVSPLWRYGYGAPYGSSPALATVEMTHGYDVVPLAVKAVAYELAQSASELSSGSVKAISSPGYRIQWGPLSGVVINEGQIGRLSKYKIGGIK